MSDEKSRHLTIDQTTAVNLTVVITVVSALLYFSYAAGGLKEQVTRLDGLAIERRLAEIEVTLKILTKKTERAELPSPFIGSETVSTQALQPMLRREGNRP